jgi:hypothetical protein
MKYSFPGTPCCAGLTPVNTVTHPAIVDEGSVESSVSSRYACSSFGPPSSVARFGSFPPRSMS